MDLKEKTLQAFQKQAATYDHDINGKHARDLYPAMLEEMSGLKNETVLDLGCGTGAILKQLVDLHPGIQAYGIDLSENMLAEAKEKLGDKAKLLIGDAEHLPFDDSFFDIVFCNDSFHHYPSPELAIGEAFRVLKNGGRFIIGDVQHKEGIARNMLNVLIRFSSDGDVRFYSEAEIRHLLSAKFQDVTWHSVSNESYLATAVKP